MIQGRVPGVVVNGTSIQIRGQGSINGGTQPIFIVNGVEAISIDDISPNDVKSISVLKGADTAIYGVKGANGVILIRTK